MGVVLVLELALRTQVHMAVAQVITKQEANLVQLKESLAPITETPVTVHDQEGVYLT